MQIFYGPAYTIAGNTFETTRKAGWVADALRGLENPEISLVEPVPLAARDVEAAHAAGYVESVRSGAPRTLAESQGFPWSATLFPSVCASNGGAVAAALQALADGVAGSLSSGMHHARRDYGAGFCTFNGLVLAAKAALAHGAEKVLILDLDAHCGGGTDELVRNEPRIAHLDISVNTFDRYASSRACDALWLVENGTDYLATVAEGLRRFAADDRCFDLCIYNAGVDPFEGCRLGGLPGITAEDLRCRDELVFSWFRERNVPTAFVLAGGYVGPSLTREGLIDLHLATVDAARASSRT
jgi:acetoin utilization deacetylase AcuC-like enzyme